MLATEALTNILNEHYLIAERLMSLRHPKHDDFKAAVNKVNCAYKSLVKSLSNASQVNLFTKNAAKRRRSGK